MTFLDRVLQRPLTWRVVWMLAVALHVAYVLAPFDVRQGNFGGLLLNAVTKSGTNDFTGSAFYFYRNQDYGRNVPALRATAFDRTQVGFSIGGPIIKNKLHFFTANEIQRENSPISGPYFGQDTSARPSFPLTPADIQRFESIMSTKYHTNPGPSRRQLSHSPSSPRSPSL